MEKIDKTLLEILLEELPARGGWPDGADEARQDYDGEICFSGGCGIDYDFYYRKGFASDAVDIPNEARMVTVYHDEYVKAVSNAQ